MGSTQNEGTLLLVTSRNERSVCCSCSLRLGFDLPLHGTYCQVIPPRMDVEIPSCYDFCYLLRSASVKLAAPLKGFPWNYVTASTPRFIPTSLNQGALPRVVEWCQWLTEYQRLLTSRDDSVRQGYWDAQNTHSLWPYFLLKWLRTTTLLII